MRQAQKLEDGHAAYQELGRIGNNLNQLARVFHLRSGEDPEAPEVLSELRALLSLLRAVQRHLLATV